ncbi:MAG: hypothetical protein ACYC4N_18480, partial [Pirellulaceae bacterium]
VDLFQQIIDVTTSAFQESNPLDGDSLIAGLVQAFNELSATIDSLFQSPSADPATVPPEEVVALLENAPADPSEVLTAEPAQSAVTPPAESESPATTAELSPDTAPSSGSESELVEAASSGETPAITNDVIPVTGPPDAAGADQEVAAAANQPTTTLVGSVMMRVRLQVIQSLKSLVDTFDTSSSSRQVSQSIFRASAQLSVRYSLSGSDANRIDTQV